MITPAPQIAAVLVDELVRSGVREACLSPGSRSAPLAVALHRDARIRVHVRHDERSAAFLALGIARAAHRPVAVVSTSGSAAANWHPAVVEADASRVPLLLLTADRPPELRGTGANQTIDQIKLFGSAVRWFCEVGLPDPALAAAVRSIVSRAFGEARGAVGGPAGPVHLNLPFREPLVPRADEVVDPAAQGRPGGAPWTATGEARRPPDSSDIGWLTERIQATERGVLVVGDTDVDPRPLVQLAEVAGWPIIAEPQSGARSGGNAISVYDHLLRDAPFAAAHDPDLAVIVGRLGVSRTVLSWLSPDVAQVLVDRDGLWLDPGRSLQRIVTGDPDLVARSVVDDVLERQPGQWLTSWQRGERVVRAALDAVLNGDETPSEPRVARDLAATLPSGAALVVASSMPVRDLAGVMAPRDGLRVLANRGASGIDGFVSTAMGVATVHDGPTVALAGDLSVLHDQNGLLPTPTGRPDLVVVVVNNDGGGIFSFLPQATLTDGFEMLFGTPHAMDFEAVAGAYGMGYRRVERAGALADTVLSASAGGGLHLIEVRTDRRANVELHRRIQAAVQQAMEAAAGG